MSTSDGTSYSNELRLIKSVKELAPGDRVSFLGCEWEVEIPSDSSLIRLVCLDRSISDVPFSLLVPAINNAQVFKRIPEPDPARVSALAELLEEFMVDTDYCTIDPNASARNLLLTGKITITIPEA